jgi:hypothetical protein
VLARGQKDGYQKYSSSERIIGMKTVDEQIQGDAKELRDIAQHFDERGKRSNGDFLREIANKLEVLWGAYRTSSGDHAGNVITKANL